MRVVIIGGGIIGAAVAYFLGRAPGVDVTLLESDPTHARAATALSASGVRHQFSSPVNVAISQFASGFLRQFRHPGGGGMGFREPGYLFLATAQGAPDLIRAHATQTAMGAEVALLDPAALAARFPHLVTHDLALASLGLRGEGWFDNMALLGALTAHARAAGVRVLHARATGLTMAGRRVTAVRVGDLALPCDWAVNAAGPQAARVSAWAGIALPVEPRKRTVFHFVTRTPAPASLPLMITPCGVWCRPEGAGFIAGAPPPDDGPADPDDFAPAHDQFEGIVWPALAARSALWEAVRVRSAWAGHYDWNRIDQNAILGPHPDCPNLMFANGFSGHGLQQAPAVGRGVAAWITTGAWGPLDLAPLDWSRLAAAPDPERAVV